MRWLEDYSSLRVKLSSQDKYCVEQYLETSSDNPQVQNKDLQAQRLSVFPLVLVLHLKWRKQPKEQSDAECHVTHQIRTFPKISTEFAVPEGAVTFLLNVEANIL